MVIAVDKGKSERIFKNNLTGGRENGKAREIQI